MSHSTIRTFRAASVREALALVRGAFGPDAVILQAREVPGTLFRKAEFEVMAALDDAQAAATAGKQAARSGTAAQMQMPPPSTQSFTAAYDSRGAPAVQRPEAKPRYTPPPAPVEEPAFTNEPGFALPSQRAGERQAARGGSFSEWHDEVRDLRAALDEARAMLSTFSAQGRAGAETQLAPAASEANAKLLSYGIDASTAALLVRAALASGAAQEPAAILEAIRTPLANRLTADRAPWLRGGRHTLAFVGPTGVGKTTTLAKVAARALMEGNRRVGLITVDTYRIGASEQLARYGEIMDVPAFVAKNAKELAAAIERCARCELILIDTAGRSSPDQLQRQVELVRSVPDVELHLVASATSGSRDLAAIAERYSPLRPDRLVITKVDEAVAPGALLSAATGLGVPVSCVCNGQRVPEDIHAVTRADLVDLVLGSWNNDRI